MRRGAWLLLMGLVLSGCDGDGGEEAGREAAGAVATGTSEQSPSWQARLLADVDRRELTALLRDGLGASSADRRAAAALGVARIRQPGGERLLERAVRDPDPTVRGHAALGLGASGGQSAAAALLGAVAAETDASLRADMLWDLGRLGRPETLPALRHALEARQAGIREGACRGLAAFGQRGRVAPPELMGRVAARMLEDGEPTVRVACAHALARLPRPVASPEGVRGLADDLREALRDEEPEVRLHAVRALARYPAVSPEALARRTGDPDYRVAVRAFQTLSERLRGEPDAVYARALRERVDRSLAGDRVLEGPELQVLLGALEAAAPFARGRSTHGVAVEVMERLAAREDPTEAEGRAHCAASELADRGRRWPEAVLECGLGHVSEDWRRRAAARVAGASEGPPEVAAQWLERLYGKGPGRVRQAVLAAVPEVGLARLNELVLRGLRSGDRGIATVALEAVRKLAPRWLAEGARGRGEAVPPGVEPLAPPYAHALRGALEAAHATLTEADYAAGLVAWLEAVGVLRAADLAQEARALTLHPNVTVRRAAGRATAALGEGRPKGEVPPPRHPLQPDDFVDRGEWSATLETSRGTVVIELWETLAPGTVTRFVQLAREGFYDGTGFHHRVPGFVVQGGDPRGDGHGGPGFRVRSEDHRRGFAPGVVGMAQAGRDTAGSQFFIMLTWAPHLRERYTAFGRVRSGMEVVERLQEGDRIRSVSVSRETP